MLENYFVHPDTLYGIRNCWLGEAIEQYIAWLVQSGYGPAAIYRRVPVLRRFGEFAWTQGARSFDDLPRQVEPFVSHWIAERDSGKNAERTRQFGNEIRGPVEQLLLLIVPGFVRRGRQPLGNPDPFVTQAPDFFSYLRNERGLRELSIKHYRHFGTKDTRAEQAVAFRLERPVVDRFRLFDFTKRPGVNFLRARDGNLDLVERLSLSLGVEKVHYLLVHPWTEH